MPSLLPLTKPPISAFIFSIPETSNVKSDRAISKVWASDIGNRVYSNILGDILGDILGNELRF